MEKLKNTYLLNFLDDRLNLIGLWKKIIYHLREKLEKLMLKLILISNRKGDAILDPLWVLLKSECLKKRLNRYFAGIKSYKCYASIAMKRPVCVAE